LVENSSGSYEDRWTHIDKIFDTRQKAQEYIEKVLNRIYDLNIISDSLLDNDFDEKDKIYESEIERFKVDFPDSHWDEWEGNTFRIIEKDVE
jgi:hypothetical protein